MDSIFQKEPWLSTMDSKQGHAAAGIEKAESEPSNVCVRSIVPRGQPGPSDRKRAQEAMGVPS